MFNEILDEAKDLELVISHSYDLDEYVVTFIRTPDGGEFDTVGRPPEDVLALVKALKVIGSF